MAQRVGRVIALLFHDHGTRRGWVVSSTPRPYFTPGKVPVSIVQEGGWAPVSVWMGVENLAPPGFDPRTVHPVASRYTDWATRPTRKENISLQIHDVNMKSQNLQNSWQIPQPFEAVGGNFVLSLAHKRQETLLFCSDFSSEKNVYIVACCVVEFVVPYLLHNILEETASSHFFPCPEDKIHIS